MSIDETDKQQENLLVEALVKTKREILMLKQKEEELKQKLLPYLEKGNNLCKSALVYDFARIYYVDSKGTKSFNRKKVLEYIRRVHNDKLADDIDLNCTSVGKAKRTVYVKIQK